MFGSIKPAHSFFDLFRVLPGLAQGCTLSAALALLCSMSMAQPKVEPARAEKSGRPPPTSRPAMAQGNAVSPPVDVKREVGTPWEGLSHEQQSALRPLANSWSSLNANQKRKWIAMSRNHASLSPQEQGRVHGRMSEWAALSSAERNQARFNYSGFRELSAQEKSAQWEAYQALSPEQRKALAQQRPAKSGGAAVAATGVPAGKLVPQPELGIEQAPPSSGKRRAKPKLVPEDRVDANTLLPQQP
jgi:hypothetical protein